MKYKYHHTYTQISVYILLVISNDIHLITFSFFRIDFGGKLNIAKSHIFGILSLTALVESKLEESCNEEKENTEFEDDMHGEVLEEDGDDNDIQWHTEEVHGC